MFLLVLPAAKLLFLDISSFVYNSEMHGAGGTAEANKRYPGTQEVVLFFHFLPFHLPRCFTEIAISSTID